MEDLECPACTNDQSLLHTTHMGLIDDAVARRCEQCMLFEKILRKYAPMLDEDDPISILRNPATISLISESNYPKNAPLEIIIYGITSPGPWTAVGVLPPVPTPASELPNITGNTSSDAAFRLMEEWIKTCDADHKCRDDRDSFFPNRVVDVGNQDIGFYIRLCDVREELPDGENYVCLSHSWGPAGGDGLLKTTRSNILQLRSTIDWKALPRTYQDAVLVTRRLGIQFLWIDSLCIIQDDDEDWHEESTHMGDIYYNAYVTLAASKGTGPHDGLFTLAPHEYKLLSFLSVNTLSNYRELRTRRSIAHFESQSNFPLMRRGWVFQERILSRRIIHFAAYELIWECMMGEQCECSLISGSFDPGRGFASKSFYEIQDKTLGRLQDSWCKIVMEYTTMQLTFEKDIFPALSGIASRHLAARRQIEPDEQYIAGMWLTSLPWDLIWHTPSYRTLLPGEDKAYQHTTRPQINRAPSWSWASIRTEVVYDTIHAFNFDFEVPNLHLEFTGGETGEVKEGAKLVLSGKIGEVVVEKRERGRGDGGVETCLSYLGKDIGFRVHPDYDFFAPSIHQIREGHTLKCFIMGTNYKPDNPEKSLGTWFMMLNELGQDDTYVRVGLAYLLAEDGETTNKAKTAFLGSLEKMEELVVL